MKLIHGVIGGQLTLARLILISGVIPMSGLLAVSCAARGFTDPGLADLVAQLTPSVVNITTTRYKDIQIPPGKSLMAQAAEPGKSIWYGSGFIVATNGLVVTNKHVVHNGVDFRITMSNGQQFPADLIGESQCCDIAVLKIQADRPFPVVKLGDSDTVRQGDFVIAIGNPLNHPGTVTTGIISALNRDLHFTPFDDYIQTDAAINEGNSGGPLFNAQGEVIGVSSSLYTTGTSIGSVGIGFAIPINDAKFLVAHMREYQAGKYKPAWLGVQVQSLTPALASAYGLPGPWGSIVLRVQDGSPAAQAGLRPGDIITSFANKFLEDSRALLRTVIEALPGTTAPLGVLRDGKEQSVLVTLGALPSSQMLKTFLGQPGVPQPKLPSQAVVNFGLETAAVTPELRARYHLGAQQQGVVVTGVAIGSTAANNDINAGALIEQIRDVPVGSPDDVMKSVDNERKQQHQFVPILLAEPSGLRWVSLPLQ
jgi:serine protease Do